MDVEGRNSENFFATSPSCPIQPTAGATRPLHRDGRDHAFASQIVAMPLINPRKQCASNRLGGDTLF